MVGVGLAGRVPEIGAGNGHPAAEGVLERVHVGVGEVHLVQLQLDRELLLFGGCAVVADGIGRRWPIVKSCHGEIAKIGSVE